MDASISHRIQFSRSRRVILVSLLTSLLTTLFAWPLQIFADHHTSVHNHLVCAPDGVALGGFDVVSYHAAAGPVAGQPAYTYKLDGLTYLFANAENLARFRTSPAEYLPSYLGWCSTNLAMGHLACPDFANFKIENGKLYLFEHVGFTNGRDVWNTDPTTHKQRADQNFIKLSR